jgi:hypothetical protein
MVVQESAVAVAAHRRRPDRASNERNLFRFDLCMWDLRSVNL